MTIGEIDPRCIAESNQLPKLTPEQAAAHTWKPDAATWSEITRRSAGRPATVTIAASGGARAQVRISTSTDPVGAPIFYRDVPLMPTEVEKGVIKPIIPSAVPLIAWRLRNVAESGSRLVMEGLPTCANCHSFSRDGKTLGLDVDGPQNDKGTVRHRLARAADRRFATRTSSPGTTSPTSRRGTAPSASCRSSRPMAATS